MSKEAKKFDRIRTIIRKVLLFGGGKSDPNNWNLTRHYMYNSLGKRFLDACGEETNILSISNSDRMVEILGLSSGQLIEGNYPEVDLRNLPYSSETLDYVIADQVIEHIDGKVEQAFSEAHRVLKPGGRFVCATCTMMPLHHLPHDYWRFTPMGLRYLGRNFGSIEEEGSWGNPFMPAAAFAGLQYQNLPRAGCLLRKIADCNMSEWPCVVWIILRK